MLRLAEPSHDSRTCEATLQISDAVVSLCTVEGRLEGVRFLQVQPAAVVTPAVLDLLKENNVQLARRRRSTAERMQTNRLFVANLTTRNVEQLLAEQPYESSCQTFVSLEAAMSRVVSQLSDGKTLGLMITDLPEAAVWMANQSSGVRAIFGRDEAGVRRANLTIAANLLVIEPTETNNFQMRRLLEVFCATPRQINSEFRTLLT